MSFLSRFGWSAWNLSDVAPPWGVRPSIHRHIATHLSDAGPGLTPGGDELPDEARVRGDSQFGWVPGAMDGAFGHHGGPAESDAAVSAVSEALEALADRATTDRADRLYSVLTSHSTMAYADQLLQQIAGSQALDPDRVHAIGYWLATEAADREPVKLGIALLGLFRHDEDRDVLLTLGRHEEFTLYVTVALQNREPNERTLFGLARQVTGWGRVHLVERLAETRSDEIRAWMLREGYQNDIMWEYTALICARSGGLLEALRLPDPDDALLRGAGDLLATLTSSGGPAEGMESYTEGSEATERWLRHLRERADLGLEQLLNVRKLRHFVEDDEQTSEMTDVWTPRRASILALAREILERPEWLAKVRAQLESPDRSAFWTAAELAKELGIDPWEHYFERVQRGQDFWWNLMQTDDAARIDRVVELAERTLPLDAIASGPADSMGMGSELRHHHALDFVLQDLRRFPGKGWALIRAGLRSPLVRNRNMALHALSAWPRISWPPDADALIHRLVADEPNERTSALARSVLAGETMDA